jgi:hypothetical protein
VFGRGWVGDGVLVYDFPLSMFVASGRVVSILCVWVLCPYAWVRLLLPRPEVKSSLCFIEQYSTLQNTLPASFGSKWLEGAKWSSSNPANFIYCTGLYILYWTSGLPP